MDIFAGPVDCVRKPVYESRVSNPRPEERDFVF